MSMLTNTSEAPTLRKAVQFIEHICANSVWKQQQMHIQYHDFNSTNVPKQVKKTVIILFFANKNQIPMTSIQCNITYSTIIVSKVGIMTQSKLIWLCMDCSMAVSHSFDTIYLVDRDYHESRKKDKDTLFKKQETTHLLHISFI